MNFTWNTEIRRIALFVPLFLPTYYKTRMKYFSNFITGHYCSMSRGSFHYWNLCYCKLYHRWEITLRIWQWASDGLYRQRASDRLPTASIRRTVPTASIRRTVSTMALMQHNKWSSVPVSTQEHNKWWGKLDSWKSKVWTNIDRLSFMFIKFVDRNLHLKPVWM